MTFRTQYLAWLTLILLILNAVVWGLAQGLIMKGFSRLEAEFAGRQLARARGALEREAEYLRRIAVAEAASDDLFSFMGDPDPGFIRRNFTDAVFQSGRLNGVILADRDGTIRFSRGFDLATGKETLLSQDIFSLLPQLLPAGDRRRGAAGLLETENGLFLAAAAPVQANDEKGPMRGMLLFLRHLDEWKVAALSEWLQLDIGIRQKTAEEGQAQAAGMVSLLPIEGDKLVAVTSLTDLLGRRGEWLEVTLDREIVRAGRRTVGYFQAWVGVTSLLFGGLAFWMLNLSARAREQRAEDLRRSEERYRLLFENNPLPMWLYDVDTLRFLAVNEAAVQSYGYSRAEFLGMTIKDIRPPEAVPQLLERLNAAGQGFGRMGVWRHRKRDGSLIDVDITIHTMESGGREKRLVVAHDVTEEIRFRQEAERAGRLAALGELVAGIAHEINNPCGMLLINLSLVSDVLNDALPYLHDLAAREEEFFLGGVEFEELQQQLPQTLEDMLRGTRHIRSIVEELKRFARPETATAFAPFDLNGVVQGAIRLTGNAIEKATDRFEALLAGDLPPTRGREQQIEQVVINLLLNACQALSGRGCGIRVQTRHDPKRRHNIVEVFDEGVGIPSENLDRVTDPFFTTRRDSGGTGLGLSVSARLVREHGGELEFQSEPGRGTAVRLCLPIHEETDA